MVEWLNFKTVSGAGIDMSMDLRWMYLPRGILHI